MREDIHVGDKVQWTTVNGTKTGVVKSISPRGIVIRLASMRYVIAQENSVKKI